MNKGRIVELIEGLKRWEIYEPPTLPTVGIRTHTPWGEMRPYHQIDEDIDVIEKYLNSLTRVNREYLLNLDMFDRTIPKIKDDLIDTNVHNPPVSLFGYIMNEGDDNE